MHVALGSAAYSHMFCTFQYSVRPLVSQLDLGGEPKLAFRFKWWLSKLHGRLAPYLTALRRYTYRLIYTFTSGAQACAIKHARTPAHTNVTNTFPGSNAHSLTYDTRRHRYNRASAILHVHRHPATIQF